MYTSVILFACFGALVLAEDPPVAPVGGSYGGSAGGYGSYGGGYPNPSNIIYDIQALIGNVTLLNENDEKIDMTLEELLGENRANSVLRETFLKETYPGIQKEQAAQDALLTDLEKKAKALLRLSDDVNQIEATIEVLQYQLNEINETRQEYLARIAELRNTDAKQDADLDKINSDLAEQENKLEELEGRSHEVAARIVKLEKTLHQVFDALNSETAQTVEFTLTPENDVQTIYLTADFGDRRAEIQYGITSLHTSDHENSYSYSGYGYGGYGQDFNNPNINFSVDVELDREANKVTARLFDLSKGGFIVNKVTVAATVFRLDDRYIDTYA